MWEIVQSLVDTNGFHPRWHTVGWNSAVGWLHIIGDLALWLAYVAVPILVGWFIRRRNDEPLPRTFWIFSAIVIACGMLHLLDVVLFWHPTYRIAGLIKLSTAVLAWTTIPILARVLPRVLQLPGAARLNQQLKAEIQEQKKREIELERFFSLSQDLIGCAGFDGYFKRVNPASAQTLGFTAEELQSRPFIEFVHTDDREATLAEVWKLAQGEVTTHFEVRVVCRDGSYKWLAFTGTPVVEESVFFVAGRDITQQRADEAALRASNAMLEELRQESEAANRSKSEFLANMSHEIRTPMTAILGFADVMLISNPPAENLHALQTIKRNGEYLLNIINDILDHSKIEAGRLSIEQIPCSPLQVLDDAVALLRNRAETKGLTLQVNEDGPLPASILTDPTRLRQVLINVIGNGIKFTERGSVTCTVRRRETTGSLPMICFDIVDTGIGMTHEQRHELFLPFSQADSSMTRRFGGTGLGLAISKRLVAMLGGEITVTSTPGQGSTFSIQIPDAGQERTLAIPREQQAPVALPAPIDEMQAKIASRVLLADDSLDNQRLLQFFLNKAGAEVEIVENGQMAVDMAWTAQEQDRPYDIVLMDMQMPVLDGYAATRVLRDRGYRGVIIALTAHAMSSDRDACLAAGCDDYAAKPIDRLRLVTLLRRHSKGVDAQSPRPAAT